MHLTCKNTQLELNELFHEETSVHEILCVWLVEYPNYCTG